VALPTVAFHKPLRACTVLNRARLPGHRNPKEGVIDMAQLRKLEEQVAAWPHISVHPHRFGGREFRFGNAELGHVHLGGTVDIPFPAPFAMRFWRKALRNRTAGSPIQDGPRFRSGTKETSSMLCGSWACHTCAMRLRRPATLAGSWSARAKSSA